MPAPDDDPPLLLTPGPLSTPPEVRAALGRDWGSRDPAFVALSERVRSGVAALVASPEDHTAVLLQGSGTFAVEAMLRTFVPSGGQALVLINGAYGRRIRTILEQAGRAQVSLTRPEHEPVDGAAVEQALDEHPGVTHVVAVHCETTTGLLNPLDQIAAATHTAGRRLLVDAMSAFAALPTPGPFDAVAASSNKCLEGVPGVGFVVARTEALAACEGQAGSLSLDLHAQWRRFEQDGQWRFTPPTQVLAGLDAALARHTAEGGTKARGRRYADNCRTLIQGMRELGFETLLPDHLQAPIIVTFREPAHPSYRFDAFYDALVARGFAIYPGKLSEAPSFRIGCIGHLTRQHMKSFLQAVQDSMRQLGVDTGRPEESPR